MIACFSDDAVLESPATAYLLVLISQDGGHRTLPPGRYDCDLARDARGDWRITRRVVTHDHDYRLDEV